MNRYEVENLYLKNGLQDFKLQSIEDILECHDINVKTINGYNTIDDLSKRAYEKFIVKFLNCQGLDSRMGIVPTSIYYVEDTECFVKDPDEPQYIVPVTHTIVAIDINGSRKIISSNSNDEYKSLEITKQKCINYLRVEYTHHGREEWLHIIDNGEQWY